MSPFFMNLVDRVLWTVFQALGGTVAAGEVSDALHVGVATDWRPGLVGALVAGVLCLLKVLGVHVSSKTLTAVEDAAGSVARLPGVGEAIEKVKATPAGGIAADVIAGVDRQLHAEADRPAKGGPVD
ncbi:hypothetical protein [Amycolatopsis sp. WAC 04197]|uniref:hypothetical protein n=1 Tax=Amycolatopsis sp. WAC 04197 TaxID=2203199 RepID=UPI000F7700E6|nr:hypothetical protein [Amycolatopsis sp. WAC 04197]